MPFHCCVFEVWECRVVLYSIVVCNILGSDAKVSCVTFSTAKLCCAEDWRETGEKMPWAPNSTFPKVEYLCEHECYGLEDLDECSECIDAFSGNNTGHVWVVGAGIHVMNRNMDGNNVTREQKTVQEISQFLDRESSKRVIFVSPPYFIHREDYKHQQTRMDRLYLNLMPYVAPQRPDHPFLDVHQLTKSCHMKNCSYDGNHRSRYVNRWKAQLLLNLLCQV